jgi:phosphohistidine phosphatase SixA
MEKLPSLPPEPDHLHAMGVLTRREIEARLLAPLLAALSQEFDKERLLEITRRVVMRIARQQGSELAARMKGNNLAHFADSLADWQKDGAMQIEVLEQTPERFSFDVRRCRYAEMYRALGTPELGELLSCNRDFSLIRGFNPRVQLTRTQTIMGGAEYCDFRFLLREEKVKTLLVLRHAKSSWDNPDIADIDRPLNKRGKRDAPKMGALLRKEDLVPDLIIGSTAKRVRETVERVIDESGFDGDIQWNESLYAVGPEAFIEVLQEVPDMYSSVMVVGHNPGLEELVAMLTDSWESLTTAALAQINLKVESWSELGYDPVGKLVNVWRPKEL